MANKLDDELLQEIGFVSDNELKAFLQKMNQFFLTLTPTEKKVLRATLRDCPEAVRSFHVKVTLDQLREFMKNREPQDAEFTTCVLGQISKRKKDPA